MKGLSAGVIALLASMQGSAARYPADVAGLVLIDSVHEDGYVTYGGQAHHLREQSRGRGEPPPRIARDRDLEREARSQTPPPVEAIEAPLDRMPAASRQQWQWATSREDPAFTVQAIRDVVAQVRAR